MSKLLVNDLFVFYFSLPPVPPYLGQGPPVLLHPDRVVPLGEYERFERSYQPNVALLSLPNQEHSEVSLENYDKHSCQSQLSFSYC